MFRETALQCCSRLKCRTTSCSVIGTIVLLLVPIGAFAAKTDVITLRNESFDRLDFLNWRTLGESRFLTRRR